MENNFSLILSGGKGRRLWPVSREEKPKQFLDFFHTGRTFLQATYDRMRRIVPKQNIYISTNEAYAHFVREQLPEVAQDNILMEPVYRGTSASVAWAAYRIGHMKQGARMIVVPSDQAILDDEAFRKDCLRGLDFVAQRDALLSLGVVPERADQGYGYIQKGSPVEGDGGIYKVKSFTEKPDGEYAEMFCKSGEFLWNTGIFLGRAEYLTRCFDDLFQEVKPRRRLLDEDYDIEREKAYIEQNFASYPNLPIDYGILEKSRQTYVLHGAFPWADLGTWHSLYETLSCTREDNLALSGRVLFDNASANVVHLPEGMRAVVEGLDGYIVALQGDTLMITRKREDSSVVKKLQSELELME